MKSMAVIDVEGKVVNVIICVDEQQDSQFLVTYTSINPAYVGGEYLDGYFYPAQPFASWRREQGRWLPPIPQPTTQGNWMWNEELLAWED
jgi:hypothetical protein